VGVQEYDRKLKEARLKGKRRFNVHETVDGRQIEHSSAQLPPTVTSLGRDASTASIASSSNFQLPESSGASRAALWVLFPVRSGAVWCPRMVPFFQRVISSNTTACSSLSLVQTGRVVANTCCAQCDA